MSVYYKPDRPISAELLDLIEWLDKEDGTEFQKGMVAGLKMAECMAEAVERNSEY